jgi:hypothetical protein
MLLQCLMRLQCRNFSLPALSQFFSQVGSLLPLTEVALFLSLVLSPQLGN